MDILAIEALKGEFKNLLLSTNRRNIDNVINWLETKTDFFSAPSSANYHGNHEHGLLVHSMNVYKISLEIYNSLIKINPDLHIDFNSIIISALLHDICKVNFYKPTQKWKKNEANQWVSYDGYVIEDTFPIGHGEKSVMLLQMLGLEMKVDEMLAIRWHMGAWDGGLLTNEVKFAYNKSAESYPLCVIIQAADNLSSMTLEKTKEN
jgi:hypothetical protein